MDPQKLILLLYKEALKRLKMAKMALEENNPCKRGENLGRAIAIISELHSSLDTSVDSDEIHFLKNLYEAILTELPKVSINNDVKIIDTTIAYFERLKDIWENNVMQQQPKQPQTKSMPEMNSNTKPATRLKAVSV
jgi:flagellar protein FliS